MSDVVTVSDLIVTPHLWPFRSEGEVAVDEACVDEAETTKLDGSSDTAMFAETNVFGENFALAAQQESAPGYTLTNWIPNVNASVLQYCWGGKTFDSSFRKFVAHLVWGDAFVVGFDEIDGKKVFRDLTPGEEDKVLKFLLEFETYFAD